MDASIEALADSSWASRLGDSANATADPWFDLAADIAAARSTRSSSLASADQTQDDLSPALGNVEVTLSFRESPSGFGYFLVTSGDATTATVPNFGDIRLLFHVHPDGGLEASLADLATLSTLRNSQANALRLPQSYSPIIARKKDRLVIYKFNEDGKSYDAWEILIEGSAAK